MAAELLHELLDEAAERRPDHPAVRCNGVELTYRALRDAANGIATTLIGQGVKPGDRVGILLPKRVETIAAVYGALKAGAAYVPLDPRAPVSRVAGVAGDCAVTALVTTASRADALLKAGPDLAPAVLILVDATEDEEALPVPSISFEEAAGGNGGASPSVAVASGDLAYILYTSGSTGVPKGVMLTHGNALAFVNWCAERIGISPDDRVSNHAPLHFDLSVLDLYLPPVAGATLVPVPEEATGMGSELLRFIREESITLWYSVPSALMMITRSAGADPGALSSLRTVIFAGEVYPMKHLRELRALVGADLPLWNLYGPTETNVCTYYRVGDLPAEDDATLPIGQACENGTHAFAVDEGGDIVEASGGLGELLVAGPTVMQGYWGMPERTAEVLITDPRGGDAPAYRTGDVVRLREDDGFDFLGRRDHQVKSRGYRIELGEVDAVLNANPDLAEAVAVAVPHEEWGTAIIACAVARQGADVRPVDVRRRVAEHLPRYMVPVRVDLLDEMPRTPNGKIDRAAVEASAASKPI